MEIMIDISRIETDFSELDKVELVMGEPFILAVLWGGVTFEFFVHLRKDASLLTIFGNGRCDRDRVRLPVFQRYSWASEIDHSMIIWNDPTLYLGEIRVGWGQGTADRFYLEDVRAILDVMREKLNMTTKQFLFAGSSAGGFTSLYLAGLMKGSRAFVNNPQTVVYNYYPFHLNMMYSASYPGFSREDIEAAYENRLSVVSFFREIRYVPSVFYLQNLAAKYDVQRHLKPFMTLFQDSEQLFQERTRVQFCFYFDAERGHNPLGKAEFLRYLHSYAMTV